MFDNWIYFCALLILSYNAIFNFIITNRNFGKTWSFKKRAWRRAIKKGKKTIWLRIFAKEKKEAIKTMFASSDLQKYCGIVPYNTQTKQGNFKQDGNTFYYKDKKGVWRWFLKVYAVSDANAIRSADDVDVDTIVFDEFTTTPSKLKHYRGDIVNDFIDIFYSAKREHNVRCFFLGNKENVLNPFMSYFGIKQPPYTWQGIKTYRNGSIAYQQINNLPKTLNDYDKKCKDLLEGTKYGEYLYQGKYKGQNSLKTRKYPTECDTYIQMCINGYLLKIGVLNGYFYVCNKCDTTQTIYTIEQMNKYKRERLLVKRQKQLFSALINAISDGRVYYNSIETYSAIQAFYMWLGI